MSQIDRYQTREGCCLLCQCIGDSIWGSGARLSIPLDRVTRICGMNLIQRRLAACLMVFSSIFPLLATRAEQAVEAWVRGYGPGTARAVAVDGGGNVFV